MISIEWLSQESVHPTDVAFALVHEATHARLERLGFRYTAQRRLRLEAICTQAEVALAEALPDHVVRLAGITHTLEQLGALYSEANLHAGRMHALRELGAPAWLVRAAEWLHRPRAA